jgi:xylulokinase
VGITGDSNRRHLARAVLEGVAYEYQQVLENMAEAVGVRPSKLVATGGGTRNGVLMGIKTAVSGLPITIPAVDEAVCLGAAMLAGVGSGIYSSFAAAAAQVQFASHTLPSDPNLHRFYRQQYERIYRTLYEALTSTNALIHDSSVNTD